MGTIGFSSGKTDKKDKPNKSELKKSQLKEKTEPVVRPDTTWYKKECHQCPYFVKDEKIKMSFCYRPFGEPCIAESLLVQEYLFQQKLNQLQTIYETVEKQKQANPVIHKKIKRRM